MWRAIHLTRERALLPASASRIGQFQALIDDLDQSSETLPLDELTEHAIDVTGLLDYHRPKRASGAGPSGESSGAGHRNAPL